MCRLLGVVAPRPLPVPALLRENLSSFTALSERHKDGWGIAYWDRGGRLCRDRAAERASESAAYSEAVRAAWTDAGMLHLRRASKGLALTLANTHPFVDGDVAFAHNGFAEPVAALDLLVAEHDGDSSEGTTDSERYFRLVTAVMRALPPAQAMLHAAGLIRRATRAESLNALLLTGDALFALRADDAELTRARGNSPIEYALHWSAEAGAVTIASTGWERHPGRWRELPRWSVLEVRRAHGDVDVETIVHTGS